MRKDGKEILHRISTDKGQSGAPIIAEEKGQLKLIGIHKGGVTTVLDGKQQLINSGRLITPDITKTLEAEIKRLGGKMFLMASTPS